MSVVSIVSTLGVLMESGVEELKVLQTILLLVTTTDVVQGKPLAKVHTYVQWLHVLYIIHMDPPFSPTPRLPSLPFTPSSPFFPLHSLVSLLSPSLSRLPSLPFSHSSFTPLSPSSCPYPFPP